ncbi:hypothetical protein ACJX0J_021730, partial [Zea mays]
MFVYPSKTTSFFHLQYVEAMFYYIFLGGRGGGGLYYYGFEISGFIMLKDVAYAVDDVIKDRPQKIVSTRIQSTKTLLIFKVLNNFLFFILDNPINCLILHMLKFTLKNHGVTLTISEWKDASDSILDEQINIYSQLSAGVFSCGKRNIVVG